MLKPKKGLTVAFILTLVAYGAAQFDMNSWFSSYEYEDSLESVDSSEEFEEEFNRSRNGNTALMSYSQKLSTASISCHLEQLPISSYRTPNLIRYDVFNCLKCRNVTILPGQKLQIQGKPLLSYIMFEDSTISSVWEGVFTDFTNFTLLYRLYLNDSFVNRIQSGAFTGLNALKELYLQNNNITRLSKWMFTDLPHLTVLNLGNNNVDFIQVNAFSDLLSLRDLHLNNNKIRIIVEHTFSGLKQLRYLDLSNNRILDVSSILFYTVGILILRHNNLTAVDFSTFPKYVEHIYLDYNQINYIENLKKIENVDHLSLSNNNISNVGILPSDVMYVNFSSNKIRELSNSVFIQAVYLVTLDFSYNLIENLSRDLFAQIGNLKEIYFQNNQLAAVRVGCFRNLYLLKVLNLSCNYITDFQFGIFGGLANLELLDISNNKATYLDEYLFSALGSLKVLNIAGNFLVSFDPYALIRQSKRLTSVRLDNNRWVCKYLSNIVSALEKVHVNVTKGFEVTRENVNGIACSNYVATTTLAPYFRNSSANIALEKLQKISDEFKVMRNFFDQDFVNSSFYKYVESFKNVKSAENFDSKYISNVLLNHIDDNFKNTTFYKYLSSSNSLESLSNISQVLRYLDINVKNADSNTSSTTSTNYVNHVGYVKNQDILLKISELQNGVTILMIMVIVMILSIVLLFIIKKISNPLMHLFNKSSFQKVSSKSTSSAEIELI